MPDLERLSVRVTDVLAATGEFGASPRVTITAIRERPRSTLVGLELDGRAGAPRLVVKIPRALPDVPSSRPRLIPVARPAERARLEFEALRAIEQDLAASPDPRFAGVQVFGLLEDLDAIVMAEVPGPSLLTVVRRSARWRRPWSSPARPGVALERTGAWLRRFQQLPFAAERPARLATRDEVAQAGREVGGFLAQATGRRSLLRSLVDEFVEVAATALPPSLPLGIHHGDFAMRNVIVTAEDRVVVIDALGRWRMPMVDDQARMLVALETSRDQAFTLGRALGHRRIRALESAFLAGYDAPASTTAVHAYAVLLTLDKWASVRESNPASIGAGVRRVAIDRHFGSVVRRFLGAATPAA
jgi:hypothetical protein